ncbi:NmrA family NAD(P)-binding protein [Dyella sp.]|uniref:NmrA family NAD(P)-binding protein n=1 Tax=Dyella sp. TaxID=1869338 RepID=UPI002FD977D4
MFAVMGVTGQVGSQVARNLLDAGQQVRVLVRDAAKAAEWVAAGCEVAQASVQDAASLAKAFAGVDGVFVMIPPDYDPAPGFPEISKIIDALTIAAETAAPGKLVFLSTVGAHVEQFSLLNNSRMVEAALRQLDMPVGFLRAAWFMENAKWDLASARSGVIPSFLQPLAHPIPMVATADIGRLAAQMLMDHWHGVHVVELEGPRRYSANDIADGYAAALGHAVRADMVARDSWEQLFRRQGMQHPEPRMRMLDGFNEGWIDFEHEASQRCFGSVSLEQVLRSLTNRTP